MALREFGGNREAAWMDALVKLLLSHGYKVSPLKADEELYRDEYLGLYKAEVIDLFTYKTVRKNRIEGRKP